jgi:hypothetical protein
VPRAQAPPSHTAAPWPSERRVWRAVCRLTAGAAGVAVAALVALHVWIFWEQLSTGQLADAGSAIRWVAGAGLLGMLAALRRQGVSLWRGRPALTTWLLVALLHGWSASAAPAVPLDGSQPSGEPVVVFVLSVLSAVVGGLLLCRLIGRRHRLAALLSTATVAAAPVTLRWAAAVRIPRAPPAGLA